MFLNVKSIIQSGPFHSGARHSKAPLENFAVAKSLICLAGGLTVELGYCALTVVARQSIVHKYLPRLFLPMIKHLIRSKKLGLSVTVVEDGTQKTAMEEAGFINIQEFNFKVSNSFPTLNFL